MPNRSSQQGIAQLLLIIILLVVLGGGYYLYSKGFIKIPILNKVVPVTQTNSNVALKSDYKNPFDANTQYVNPFSPWKNPFDNLK